MYKPYFYIIEHIPSKKYYAGCKINYSADPNKFMTENGYKTSSKLVRSLIKTDGLESFTVLKIKIFESPQQALNYETKFLKRVNASKNPKFINLHNGGSDFVNNGGYRLKKSTRNKMKKSKSKETIEKQNKQKRERSKETYLKMVESRRKNNPLWNGEEMRKKISSKNLIRFNDKLEREKHSNIMKQYYKNNPISEETKKKLSDINSGENNKMFNKKHSESTKQKMKLAWEKRKLKKMDKQEKFIK